mmetsp:Transcript_2574/g.2807  ORF Transcript_2574/g.2807 Transcript_2574/m.2807 type:complete len:84 (+) Transcript_2574:321-572(+)
MSQWEIKPLKRRLQILLRDNNIICFFLDTNSSCVSHTSTVNLCLDNKSKLITLLLNTKLERRSKNPAFVAADHAIWISIACNN